MSFFNRKMQLKDVNFLNQSRILSIFFVDCLKGPLARWASNVETLGD